MSKVYYKQIYPNPRVYPFYDAQNVFRAPPGVSPYNVADDLTRVYYRHPSVRRGSRIRFAPKTKAGQVYLQYPRSPCDGMCYKRIDYMPNHPFYQWQ